MLVLILEGSILRFGDEARGVVDSLDLSHLLNDVLENTVRVVLEKCTRYRSWTCLDCACEDLIVAEVFESAPLNVTHLVIARNLCSDI